MKTKEDFINELVIATTPDWLTIKTLEEELRLQGPGALLYGTLNTAQGLIPIDIFVHSWNEVMNKGEIVDFKLDCDIQIIATSSLPRRIEMAASTFMVKASKKGDTSRVTYKSFGSMSRLFRSSEDRDEFIDEVLLLQETIYEVNEANREKRISDFMKNFGGFLGGLAG